jgi:hypothetical protein
LQDVGDAEAGFEGVGGAGVAEVVGEDALADQSGDAAQEDASGDDDGEIGAVAELRACGARRGGIGTRGVVEAIGRRRRFVMIGFDGDGRCSPDAN